MCIRDSTQVDLIEVAVGLIPDGEAGGDLFINPLVQLLKLQPPLPDAGGLHAAPDVHIHYNAKSEF